MASKTSNPAPLAKVAGLGIVDQRAADDNPINTAKVLTLQEEADRIVAEMIALGATFEITRGAAGTSWFHHCRAGMREPLRRFKAGVDFTRPGFNDVFVRAILRAKFVGAP